MLVFSQRGVKNVTMSDIARSLGMSKKTIYVYYDNKEALIRDCFVKYIDGLKEKLELARNSSGNEIRVFFEVSRIIEDFINNFSFACFSDLKKYYHKVFKLIEEFKTSFLFIYLCDLIQSGVLNGYFRKELEVDKVAWYAVLQSNFTNYRYYKDVGLDFKTMYPIINELFLYGITTSAGKSTLHQYQFHE